jgi:hypothetical protein
VSARLEYQLKRKLPSLSSEAFNCGVSSHSPLIYYLRLCHQLLSLKPDLVVINVDLTDVFDDACRYRAECIFDGKGVPLGFRLGRLKQFWYYCVEHSYLARLVQCAKITFVQGGDKTGNPAWKEIFVYHSSLPVDSKRWKEDVGFFLDNIRRCIRICKENNVRIIVTVYPHRPQLEPDESGKMFHREVENMIRETCLAESCLFFSAYDGISRAFQADSQIYWPRDVDVHFSPKGQRVWADLVSDFVVPSVENWSRNLSAQNSRLR